MDAIERMVDLVGIDHVGIGTDFTQDQTGEFWRYIGSQQGTKFPATFTGSTTIESWDVHYPVHLKTPDDMPRLAPALLQRGYSQDDLAKMLGGNWMRLFREVWAE